MIPVAVVVFSARALRGDRKGRQPSLISDPCGSHLIGGDAQPGIRSRAGTRTHARQERALRSRVRCAVWGYGCAIREVAEHAEVGLQPFERFQNER